METMLSQCPWTQFEPATLSFCENLVCGWIRQPANAISSLSYVLVGVLVLRQQEKRRLSIAVRSIGIMGILVGLMSFAYHSSMTFPGEALDLASMYLFSSTLVVLNLLRLGWLSRRFWVPTYSGVNIGSVGLLLTEKEWGIDIFAFQVILFLALEALLYVRTRKQGVKYRDVVAGVGIFFLSYGIWLLDYHRIVCSPDNHFLQGHAVWHILNSSVFYFSYRHYRQFDWGEGQESLAE